MITQNNTLYRFRRNLILVIGLCLISLFLLPDASQASGYVEDRNGKTIVHVEVVYLPDPTRVDTASRADVAAVKEFKTQFPAIFAARYRDKYKAHPEIYGIHNWDNVEIELHPFTSLNVEGVEVDLMAIAGGTAPDVIYVNFRKSDTYIQNRFLYPLDKPEDGYLSDMTEDEQAFRINEKIWPVIQRKGPDGETHVWAIPYGGALGKVLLFRKDLFDEKGIAHPAIDWTWNDMMEAARKITDPERGTYGFMCGGGKHESFNWITFLWSAGGDVMLYNEKEDNWRCTFDTPEAAQALDFYIRLNYEKWIDNDGKVRRGYTSRNSGNAWTKWARGEIGMMMDYIDEKLFSTINPEVTGMVPVPLGPSGIRGGELNSRMLGLFAEIKEPAVRDAAWEYIRFYDCEDAVAIKTRIMVEGGLGRFVNPRLLRRFGYPEIERLSPRGWSETFDIAIATGQPEPYGRNSNVAYDQMTLPIQAAAQLALDDQLPTNPDERLAVLHGLLKRYCAKANERMMGLVPPRQRALRHICASLVLLGIISVFTLVFRRIGSAFTPNIPDSPKGWQWRRYGWAYMLLVPAVGSILLWRYIPLIRGSGMAFFDYRIIGKSTWVGLDNFGDLLFDNEWWKAVWNSLRYSFLIMFMTFLPPIILAILLQEVPRGKIFYRTIFYLPAVIAGLVTILLWKQFYEPSERGALNALVLRIPMIGFLLIGAAMMVLCVLFARRLWIHERQWAGWGFVAMGVLLFSAFGGLTLPTLFPSGEELGDSFVHLFSRLLSRTGEPFQWLSDADTAMLSCVLPMVWAGMGPGCLIYLAALKGIPEDYYEAADIDGANVLDKILFVVFPMLKALITINFVGVFIGSWYGATGSILAMTGGGANTEVAGLHIWYKAFTYLKFGPATAAAWMLGFMLIGFTVHQLRILSRVEYKAQGTEAG